MTPHTESGDRWTMYLGDCIKVMRTWDAASIDHVISDPPYEVECHTKARRQLKDATQKRGARNSGEVRRICEPIDVDFAAMTDDEREAVSDEWQRLAKRWVLAFCQIEAVAAWRGAMRSAGLDYVRGGIWVKPDATPQFTGDRPGVGFECIAIAHQPGRKRWNGGGKRAVWTHVGARFEGGSNKVRLEHPTTKPIALMCELISDFTDPGETILDSYAGSGTTGVAALRLGRRFIGIERQEKYFNLAVERLRAEEQGISLQAARSGQGALFG